MCYLTCMGTRSVHTPATQDSLRVCYVKTILRSPYMKIIYAQLSANGYTAIKQVQNVQTIVQTHTTCVVTVLCLTEPVNSPGASFDLGIYGVHFLTYIVN